MLQTLLRFGLIQVEYKIKLQRLYIAKDVEHGSFFDKRFTLGNLSLDRMVLIKNYEECV